MHERWFGCGPRSPVRLLMTNHTRRAGAPHDHEFDCGETTTADANQSQRVRRREVIVAGGKETPRVVTAPLQKGWGTPLPRFAHLNHLFCSQEGTHGWGADRPYCRIWAAKTALMRARRSAGIAGIAGEAVFGWVTG